MNGTRKFLGLTAMALAMGAAMPATAADAPWTLGTTLDLPAALSLSGTYRIRVETLDGAYRAGLGGSDQMLDERLLLNARLTMGHVFAQVELEDARQQLADRGSALGTDIVNTVEPLQMMVGARFADVFAGGDTLNLSAGRMTIDSGSRRLVARNSFRNTINAFTGGQAVWKTAQGLQVQAFYVLPVQRLPTAAADLRDNGIAFDKENTNVRFWGVHVARPKLIGDVTGEIYIYGLHARDYPGVAVADRDIYTPGFRLTKRPAAGAVDFEAEGALQAGTSRISTTATKDLRHFAGFFHLHAGYTFAAAWTPRVEASYDYASGDKDPTDGRDNRFDTLYGARRFDYGPTGIYGPFARSNISSPGVRLAAKPDARMSVMAGYRAVWLASARDQWTTARLQDASGGAGRYVGSQIEGQIQYAVIPGNVTLDMGGAYLAHGRFMNTVPGHGATGDTTYFYAALTFAF